MALRQDSKAAFFQTADPDSKTYAINCSSGTTAYADFSPGYYDCWAPTGSASEHFRWKYLASATATAAAGDIDAPTAATSAQTAGEAQAMAPGNAVLRLYVTPDRRLAILYSAAGPVTLYCTKVL